MSFIKKKSFARIISALLTFVILCISAPSAYANFDEELSTITNSSSVYSTAEVLTPRRWYLGNISFHADNTGWNRTINGNRMRACIAFKPIDGIDDMADMKFYIYRYDGLKLQEINLCCLQDEPDSDGYRYYELPWVNVSYGVDYHFYYYAYTCCWTEDRTVDCHIWVDVE